MLLFQSAELQMLTQLRLPVIVKYTYKTDRFELYFYFFLFVNNIFVKIVKLPQQIEDHFEVN
jgi:hypothetical protein